MHIHHKFGLYLLFILSVSSCNTHAAPATNQSSSYDEDYDDYKDDDYYSEESNNISSTEPAQADLSWGSFFGGISQVIPQPQRSNHVVEPSCPKACICQEDYRFVQCSNAGLRQVPHDLPGSALIIDLSHNHIKELKAENVINCTKVREINLNYNELTQLDREDFKGLHKLERLNLANNHLTIIEPQTFNEASNLTTLILSNNSIVLPSVGSFLNQTGLLELTCQNCSWTQLYDDSFSQLGNLTALKLDGNDFNKQINTKAFMPLRNLVKLRLPELKQSSVEELCNLLKSIDNISFRHFDVTCYELVLGASYNESLITATDPPYKKPAEDIIAPTTSTTTHKPTNTANMSNSSSENEYFNLTSMNISTEKSLIQTASIGGGSSSAGAVEPNKQEDEAAYQVPVSQETINIMLICIMILAVVGILIGIICRKDVGGIKTKCCRTRKPEPKDQVHPAEEIPLNKLA